MQHYERRENSKEQQKQCAKIIIKMADLTKYSNGFHSFAKQPTDNNKNRDPVSKTQFKYSIYPRNKRHPSKTIKQKIQQIKIDL